MRTPLIFLLLVAIATSTFCIFDSQCGADKHCHDGVCVLGQSHAHFFYQMFHRCTDSVECPANRKCANGSCVVLRRALSCNSPLECPDNRKCINGECIAVGNL